MTVIAAKPTIYNGIRFRSRLKARWAKFFDAIGREWTYEPQLTELAGMSYQPDFLVAGRGNESNLFEIKPLLDGPITSEWLKANGKWSEVARAAGCTMILLLGVPDEWQEGRLHANGHMGFMFFDDNEEPAPAWFAECLKCGKVGLWLMGTPQCCRELPTGPLLEAYIAVRNQSYEDSR